MFFDENLGFISLTADSALPNLFDSNQGFIHGNMFLDEYVGYKDYEIKTPKAKTEKSAYLYKIIELEFAINDLNLYLDLYPDNKTVYDIMKKYVNELLQYQSEYINKYGPLELCDVISEKYTWFKDWPWEREGGINV